MRIRTLNDKMVPLCPASLPEWEARKADILENLRFATSIDLLKHSAPLNAHVFDAVERDGFVVEKVIFQSLPGFYVTGNLYRPKDTTRKYPAVLNPHGHWENGRLETQTLARIPQRCANLAMRGMVAFSYDMIGCNDSAQVSHKGGLPEYEKWNLGRFSFQLNNSIKAVDFVSSLPYVDAARVGCTGCSGGATQTFFLAALDARVKVAAPINMVSAGMQGGCVCENTAFLRTDYSNVDYAMTIAPRPLFLSASDGDWTARSREIEFPAVERVYALYGQSENFSHFYQHAPHCYNLPIRERVYRFFCRHFGLEDPFEGEIDFEIDTGALRIGDLRDFVPRESLIDSEERLFETAKAIVRANLAKQTPAQNNARLRRVFDLSHSHALDIAYTVCGEPEKVTLGDCPAARDRLNAQFFHAYNRAPDALRVNALTGLFGQFPNAAFAASGKTAALLELARAIAENKRPARADDALEIPGICLTNGGE